MATVASISSMTSWTPEDDLLLKNAVEAGASLEALAKGAVQFSRRFNFQELQARWHSLLYDPDISAQASAGMVELELSGSNLSSKLSGSDYSKGCKDVPEKRKIGSIRRQYFSMRKRLRNEILNSNDMGVLAEPNFRDCSGNGCDFQDHITLDNEPRSGDCMLGDCIPNHFELQEMDFDILHNAFPEAMRDIVDTAAVSHNGNAFHTRCLRPTEDNSPNGVGGKDCLYGFSEDVSSSKRKDGRGSFELKIEHEDTHPLDDNSITFLKCEGVEELGPSQELPIRKHFETDDSEVKLFSHFDSVNDNPQNVCSGLGGRQQVNSSDSEGSASLNRMGLSSPLPSLPIWKTMDDISAPTMPVSVSQGVSIQGAEETSSLPDDGDGKKKTPLGSNIVQPLLRDRHYGVDFVNSTAVSEGDEFQDISGSLLNFSKEDELLLVRVDEIDAMDKSCYDNTNSVLLSSPNEVQVADVCNVEPKSSLGSKPFLATPSGACPSESENIAPSVHVNQQKFYHSEIGVPSTSAVNPDTREISDANTNCTLNTEDPDIPCNDDIFLLIHPSTLFASSETQPFTIDSSDPASSSANQKDSEQRQNLMKKGRDPAHSFTWSQRIVPNMSEFAPGHRLAGCAVKSELPDANHLSLLAPRDPSQCRSVCAIPNSTTDGVREEVVAKTEMRLVDTLTTFREMPLQAEVCAVKTGLQESVVNPSTSNQEESESDNEVPSFSDIEAMILEMDFEPHDQDSYISRIVSRYEYEGTKRTIIRLEQCARSSLQRVMTSQGALAILYGRHLRHYIRKSEVLLGRSTDEIDVDIDLRKEGRANKISRRQAIIKMETDGSFFLKNLGKSLISVNGKSVATGQLLSLASSCLIEIKGMSFVFEINEKYVRGYLDNIARKCKVKNSNFEWSPEGEP
ncbi:unnamed protein product [Ilex paraguariensis]|uniref:FHA domain-containing protein n=1 Tax=Ilex paraguariensis TaxID=185542 RepID=A0ABC8SIQ4_9AQUA